MRLALLVSVASLAAVLAGAPGGLAGGRAQCPPTVGDGGGPNRSPPMRGKIGTGHVLTGVVLSPTCAPVAGAIVSFWQSNRKGVYTPATSGAVKTTKTGRFRFEGPRPTPYDGRPAHIHIKVEAAGYEVLFTEYFPSQGSKRGTVRLVLLPSDL
jgi:protocatechuate 3,4-dioxygenase beta subunit